MTRKKVFLSLWRRANAGAVSFTNSLRCPIYAINSVDNTKLPSYTLPATQHPASLETYPLYSYVALKYLFYIHHCFNADIHIRNLKRFLNLNSVVPLLPFDFSWCIVSPFSVSFYFLVIFLPFFFCLGLISGPQSYLTSFPNVYVAASETQFYKQCFPRGSIQLGLFSVALHWLSQKPCSVTGGLLCLLTQNQEERELFTRQAAMNWETFLLAKAKELSLGV